MGGSGDNRDPWDADKDDLDLGVPEFGSHLDPSIDGCFGDTAFMLVSSLVAFATFGWAVRRLRRSI